MCKERVEYALRIIVEPISLSSVGVMFFNRLQQTDCLLPGWHCLDDV